MRYSYSVILPKNTALVLLILYVFHDNNNVKSQCRCDKIRGRFPKIHKAFHNAGVLFALSKIAVWDYNIHIC